MYINKNSVVFEKCDEAFVNKFGAQNAEEMVLDFKTFNRTPFIFDTYQLAHFLGITRKELFRLVKNGQDEYKTVTIKKKNGKTRKINAPSKTLKSCQQIILNDILNFLPVCEHAKAYKKGTSLIENAAEHVGKKYLLKIDITDFFSSIRFEQVYSCAFNTKYFPKQIGVMLTSLCCRKGYLPQGAPTSPSLSNIVMKNFDENIGFWCKKHGVSYTRYCDDITFSSDKPLFYVYEKAKAMLEEMGFELNESKTHFITNANRQSVTGITVNEKINVSSSYKRKLRQEMHYCIKYGVKQHIERTGIETEPEKYIQSLLGKVNFVLSVCSNDEFQDYRKWLTEEKSKIKS